MQQKQLIDFYEENIDSSLSVVAPTSYGKTFLMREIVFLNRERYKTILLVFPTDKMLEILPRVKEITKEWNSLIVQDLCEDDVEAFRSLLEKICQKARETVKLTTDSEDKK